MKCVKLFSVLLFTVFLAACDSTSESVSTQVFSVLSAQNALVFKDSTVTASTIDSAQTPMEKGGMTVSTYVPVSAGGTLDNVKKDVDFTYDEFAQSKFDSYVFKKDFSGTSTVGATTVDYTGTNLLVMGGKKAGLKHGDFGYWAETVTSNVTGDTTKGNYTQTDRYWATMLVFDPAYQSKDIPDNNGTNYAFSGRVLGGVDLYDKDGKLAKSADLTGTVTLNANFKPGAKNLTAAMTTNLDGKTWYDFTLTNTGGISNATGQFNGGNAVVSGTNGAGADYELPAAGFNTGFGGQFLGEKGEIPTEVLGQFELIYTAKNGKDYRPEIYGVFGAKK